MKTSTLHDIQNREDIAKLVDCFYSVIQSDELLGPIFLRTIPAENWASHLDKLTDFWESNLFGAMKFRGNPVQAHRDVDKNHNYSIENTHFVHWLQLWFKTVDSLFEGPIALTAKQRAQNMAVGQYIKMWEEKPK